MKKKIGRKRAEEPHRASSRGGHLIKANRARGTGSSSLTTTYVTDRSKDKPNTLQGTRR